MLGLIQLCDPKGALANLSGQTLRSLRELPERRTTIELFNVRGIFVFHAPDSYRFYHHDDTLHAAVLGLELPVATAFA